MKATDMSLKSESPLRAEWSIAPINLSVLWFIKCYRTEKRRDKKGKMEKRKRF